MVMSRRTWQKELLEEVVQKLKTFFTAEELLEHAQKKDKRIGLATVYRFLKEYSKAGKVHTFMCDRKLLYAREKRSHCHYICERCGKMQHISIQDLNFLKKNLPGKICHFQIEVHGQCSSCEKNDRETFKQQ